METARPSQTALRVALRRAAHQIVDSRPLVFEDPLAVRILGPEYGAELTRTPLRDDRPHSKALRAFVVARSRFAEDTLADAIGRGASQYVLLGAGLDTFAHRNAYPGLRVFEVDHPATQAWKRDLLSCGDIGSTSSPQYVAVDFERQRLAEELLRAGFDGSGVTVVAWLGVVPYLTMDAFRATLHWIETLPRGSAVVLDYGQPRRVLPALEQMGLDSLASRVALAGEPFRSFWTPDEMREELAAFRKVEDLGRDEINDRYFSGRDDGLRLLGRGGRIASAWI